MKRNYIITNGPGYWCGGSNIHNVFTFEQREAARFTEFEACLKIVQMPENKEYEVIKIK